MDATRFFTSPKLVLHRKYEAMRAFFHERMPANEVAKKFGYTLNNVYSMTKNFKKECEKPDVAESFFLINKKGRKNSEDMSSIAKEVIELRKKYLSTQDIKAIFDSQDKDISERHIFNIIKQAGFARLPRRARKTKDSFLSQVKIKAPVSTSLELSPENFTTHNNIGILCLLPYIQKYGIDKLIAKSNFPQTSSIDKQSSILAFLALKLSNFARYTSDDQWCTDRCLGFFAKLNVLPKASWFSSYSHRVTRKMNLDFLKGLNKIWDKHHLLSDTSNLDFVSIPYWGDDSHLERNWSGTRGKVLSSILAVLAQDPQSGIITYGDTCIKHKNKNAVVLEFLDFYKENSSEQLKYIVFDSKFTTYQNLKKINEKNIKFLTIRRRGGKILDHINSLKKEDWKTIRVPCAGNKTRILKVAEQNTFLHEYDDNIRQVIITGNGKIKPAIIISNDFELKLSDIVRKYAQRWLVEKDISEQTYFFHLNKLSSSMVIKVDFDLTMSILAHNILKLFALDLPGFENATAQTIFNKFISNSGSVNISNAEVNIAFRKKRNLPAILTAMFPFNNKPIACFKNKIFNFSGASFS